MAPRGDWNLGGGSERAWSIFCCTASSSLLSSSTHAIDVVSLACLTSSNAGGVN